MKEIIAALLKEVDPDIADLMMADSTVERIKASDSGQYYKFWELVHSAPDFIIKWQEFRDKKHG